MRRLETDMLKYILTALLSVVLIFNYTFGFLAKRFLKKELSPAREAAVRAVCLLLMLAGAVYIIFAG